MNQEHRSGLLRADEWLDLMMVEVSALRWFLGDIHRDSSSYDEAAQLRRDSRVRDVPQDVQYFLSIAM